MAAEIIGWQDRVGTVEAGKFADLIAVSSDPLRDLTELERVVWVMKGGTVYKVGARRESSRAPFSRLIDAPKTPFCRREAHRRMLREGIDVERRP